MKKLLVALILMLSAGSLAARERPQGNDSTVAEMARARAEREEAARRARERAAAEERARVKSLKKMHEHFIEFTLCQTELKDLHIQVNPKGAASIPSSDHTPAQRVVDDANSANRPDIAKRAQKLGKVAAKERKKLIKAVGNHRNYDANLNRMIAEAARRGRVDKEKITKAAKRLWAEFEPCKDMFVAALALRGTRGILRLASYTEVVEKGWDCSGVIAQGICDATSVCEAAKDHKEHQKEELNKKLDSEGKSEERKFNNLFKSWERDLERPRPHYDFDAMNARFKDIA